MHYELNNTQECFVQLWRRLERTRLLLGGQYKRFCIRNVLKAWFALSGRCATKQRWTMSPKRVGTNCLCLRSIRASTVNCCVLSWQ